MPQTIKNEAGEDVEVFTATEVAAQKEEALTAYKKENPDKSAEIDALKSELTTVGAELEKFKGKDLNFGNLRAQKEAVEAKFAKLEADFNEKLGNTKREVLEGVMKEHYTETLNSLTGGDVDLQKKIEFEYQRLKDPVATKEEVARKLRDAWVLATKPEDIGALHAGVLSSGGASRFNIKAQANSFTSEEKAFAQKMARAGGINLEDKDFK